MGVQFYSPRNNWCVQWQENGVRRKRYFKTEQEAHAFERERLEKKEGPRQLTLGELVALYSGNVVLHGLSLPMIAALAGIGAALGWLGAQLSVSIHLRRIG